MSKLLRCIWVPTILYLSCVLLLSGCNRPRNHLSVFNRAFETADFEKARTFAEKKISHKDTPRSEDLLWSLQAGTVHRIKKNYARSTEIFDVCEEMMSHFDSENSEIGHTIGAAAVNENIIPYTGKVYDGVMVNTYKALNFMATGHYDLARVEFNRALDRQRRAKETFNKEIQKQKDRIRTDKYSEFVQNSLDNPELQQRLQEVYPSLYDFDVYPDFVNPFSTYMAGLFFLIEGDYSKSVDLLKESAGMVPGNTIILEDLDAVNSALSGGPPVAPAIWVIFENGLGPIKEEFRIDLPLFVATNKVRYVGIALPNLIFRPSASPYLEVKTGLGTSKTQLVTNMDWVIQTEFNKDFQGTLIRSIISATAKAAAQYVLEENNNSPWAAVAMAIYSFVTTSADVRIWTTLPKNIQVTRIPMQKNGFLTLSGRGLTPFEVEIDDCKYAIVYVRMINAANKPVIDIMTFNTGEKIW